MREAVSTAAASGLRKPARVRRESPSAPPAGAEGNSLAIEASSVSVTVFGVSLNPTRSRSGALPKRLSRSVITRDEPEKAYPIARTTRAIALKTTTPTGISHLDFDDLPHNECAQRLHQGGGDQHELPQPIDEQQPHIFRIE